MSKKLESPRLRELDFLRGVAVLGVVIVHVGQKFPSGVALFDSGTSYGQLGVQLFFFVSALTMCFMWSAREKESGRVWKFYVRRFFRIAPLFWLAIPFYLSIYGVGASYWAPEGIGIRQVLLTATFLHGFYPDSINSVVPGGWSIAVEMTFYLFFPLLAIHVKERRLAYLSLSIFVWLLYAVFLRKWLEGFLGGDALAKGFLHLNFLNQAPVFLLGCYLYCALKEGVGWSDLLLVALWVSLGYASKKFMGVEGLGFVYTYICMAVAVYFSMSLGMKFSLLEKLGKRSYAIYLIHFSLIYILSKLTPPINSVAVFFMALLVVSGAAYFIAGILGRCIEDNVHSWVYKKLNTGSAPKYKL